MKRLLVTLFFILVASNSLAHDMTPTYPELKPSYMEGLLVADFELLNKRNDVRYYEVAVFDKDWNPIPFVTAYKVIPVPYLSTVSVDLFIRDKDKLIVTYICSKSKLRKSYETQTIISSRICSKVKRLGE